MEERRTNERYRAMQRSMEQLCRSPRCLTVYHVNESLVSVQVKCFLLDIIDTFYFSSSGIDHLLVSLISALLLRSAADRTQPDFIRLSEVEKHAAAAR